MVSKKINSYSVYVMLLIFLILWLGSTPGECHIDPSLPEPGPKYDFSDTSQRDADITALHARLSNCQRIFLKVRVKRYRYKYCHGPA